MDKLKMHSPDLSQDNIAKSRALFPGCVTEARDEKLLQDLPRSLCPVSTPHAAPMRRPGPTRHGSGSAGSDEDELEQHPVRRRAPITIGAARKVGEILRFVPEGQPVAPGYAFCMWQTTSSGAVLRQSGWTGVPCSRMQARTEHGLRTLAGWGTVGA